MSTVFDYEKCRQCGYEFGAYEFDCRTNEWTFSCRRCGYGESLEWIVAEDGRRIGWKHETLDGHGAVWATSPNRISIYYGLRSVRQVDESAQRMRDEIAKGDLDGESSYVTKWDRATKRAEVVAGKWVDKES